MREEQGVQYIQARVNLGRSVLREWAHAMIMWLMLKASLVAAPRRSFLFGEEPTF